MGREPVARSIRAGAKGQVPIALGSAFELETQTLVLQEREWAPKEDVEAVLKAFDEVQKMLIAFMARLTP